MCKENFTEGNSSQGWISKVFDNSSPAEYETFEEFKAKEFFVMPRPNENYKQTVSN